MKLWFIFDRVIMFPYISSSTYTTYRGMKQVHHVEEHSNFIKSALITATWILAKLGYFREKCILLLLLLHFPN